MAIHLNSFSIVPAFITKGSNELEIHINATLNSTNNNPVKAKMTVVSALDIEIDTPEWDMTIDEGENELAFEGVIIGNADVTSKKQVKFQLRLKDKAGAVSTLSTFIEYRP
ncbi:hypothetical protein LZZ85_20910 [Terrimonas sp. NA20]|uniref:DUF4625 domain-containing protein n=1 Tax=Terrimonas ginsenosidimutans TaxID=2908004 RepID=A0ABS9KWT7_9BACT|nr:hypothetical protein [Terrimonas ginsenosidimutans]MCG2616773.1 hypothetical protein [Terrimonas ginsenosidimutans]